MFFGGSEVPPALSCGSDERAFNWAAALGVMTYYEKRFRGKCCPRRLHDADLILIRVSKRRNGSIRLTKAKKNQKLLHWHLFTLSLGNLFNQGGSFEQGMEYSRHLLKRNIAQVAISDKPSSPVINIPWCRAYSGMAWQREIEIWGLLILSHQPLYTKCSQQSRRRAFSRI